MSRRITQCSSDMFLFFCFPHPHMLYSSIMYNALFCSLASFSQCVPLTMLFFWPRMTVFIIDYKLKMDRNCLIFELPKHSTFAAGMKLKITRKKKKKSPESVQKGERKKGETVLTSYSKIIFKDTHSNSQINSSVSLMMQYSVDDLVFNES